MERDTDEDAADYADDLAPPSGPATSNYDIDTAFAASAFSPSDEGMPLPADGGEDAPPPLPDAAAESAMVSELRNRNESPSDGRPRSSGRRNDAAPGGPSARASTFLEERPDPKTLPRLEDLAERLPDDVRDTLDELFRGRFITVKRVPEAVLKPRRITN